MAEPATTNDPTRRHVQVVEFAAAGGAGSGFEVTEKGVVWFRRDWLDRNPHGKINRGRGARRS